MHESLMADGGRSLETSFFVEGPSGVRGQVSLQLVEGEEAVWKERYFAVEVEGFPPQVLVQPPAPLPRQQQQPPGWHPFNRLFS